MSARRSSRRYRSLSTALTFSLAAGFIIAGRPLHLVAAGADASADTNAGSGSDVENSRFQFDGEINSNDVFVHSGPSDNDYATTKLDRGTHVTVVGIRFDWLKILPPAGSFCYVAKAFTERRDNGAVGRVTSALNVHVGSELNALKVRVAKRLEPNTDVQIIGEQDEYFKIKPPAGVFYYVNKQYVTPVRAVVVTTDDQGNTVVTAAPSKTAGQPASLGGTEESPNSPNIAIAAGTTQPSMSSTPTLAAGSQNGPQGVSSTGSTTQPAEALAPTTQPTVASAEADFDKLESDFAVDTAKPLEQQHPADLAAGYDKVAKTGLLPDSMRKIAEYKAAMLKIHADDQKQYVAVKKEQDENKARMASLRAERTELETRVKATAISYYEAVGTLRPSSLQQGQQMLYRLTDPATGRTVLYIRSNDDKIGSMVDKFVGVKGKVIDDTALDLKVIEPTAVEPVDQGKLYTSIMANIVPPSLEPAGQASTSTP